MANYYTLLTPAGLAKVTNAQLTNEKVEITQVAVGDANGAGYKPSGTETALKREVWRGGIASIEIGAQNPNWIVVEAIVPSSVGGFTMREVALFDTAGDMIAIGNYPDTYKPVANDGSTMDLALRTIIEVNNASNVTLKIDPNVIVASRAYVDAKVAGAIGGIGTNLTTLDERVTTHLAKRATKTEYGHVLLSSEISDDETVAATPKAVKNAVNSILIRQVGSGNTPILFEIGQIGATTSTTDYTKNSAYLLKGISGQLRVSYKLTSMTSSYAVYANIYRNGVAVGTETTASTLDGVVKTEDIGGWNDGDTLEIWFKSSNINGRAAVLDLTIKVDTMTKKV